MIIVKQKFLDILFSKFFIHISRGLGEHYVAKVLYDFNTDRDEELR